MIKLEKECCFKAADIFECGQCFRWNCDENGEYTGISAGKVCRVKDRKIICDDKDNEFWAEYFSLKTDYNYICSKLCEVDDKLAPCIKFGGGIRILKQDIWETIVSFIISANNNIPRIKKIIEDMCRLFGKSIEDNGKVYYSFPTPEKLANTDIAELAPLKAGYRDKYIMDAAQKVVSGEVDLNGLTELDNAELKKTLMRIKGIGSKVADCIMLFAFGRYSVFPVDVWIKRIITEVYGVEDKMIQQYVAEKYGDMAGFAQQYLYYYYRSNT